MSDNEEQLSQAAHLEEFLNNISHEIDLANNYIENEPKISFRKSVEIVSNILREIVFLEKNEEIIFKSNVKKSYLDVVYGLAKNHINSYIDAHISFIQKFNNKIFYKQTFIIEKKIAIDTFDKIIKIVIDFGQKYAKTENERNIVQQIKNKYDEEKIDNNLLQLFIKIASNVRKLFEKKYTILICLLIPVIIYFIIYYISQQTPYQPHQTNPSQPTSPEPIISSDYFDDIKNGNCTEAIQKIKKLNECTIKDKFWIDFCLFKTGNLDIKDIKNSYDNYKDKGNKEYELIYDLFLLISNDYPNSKKGKELKDYIMNYCPKDSNPLTFLNDIKNFF